MTTSIYSPDWDETATPVLIEYDFTWGGSNIYHQVLGGYAADVTIRPALQRKGTLVCYFQSEDDAWECAYMHTNATTPLRLTDSDISQISMSYFVDGDVSIKLSSAGVTGQRAWTVSIDVRETS